jgi:hypothetical protein
VHRLLVFLGDPQGTVEPVLTLTFNVNHHVMTAFLHTKSQTLHYYILITAYLIILKLYILIIHLAGHVAYTGFCLVYVQETLWGIKPIPLLLPTANLLAMYRFL